MTKKYNMLLNVYLSKMHQPTGQTKHTLNGNELPPPVELRIVQYPEDSGYYLFYCDKNGKVMTDTYHDTLEEALSQAAWEFNIKPNEWIGK